MLGAGEHLAVVPLGEVGLEPMNATQMDVPSSHHPEQQGEAAGGTRGADALRGGRLGHMEMHHAEIEHGGVAPLGPELSPVDLVEGAKQGSLVLVLSMHQRAELTEQSVVAQH